MPNTPTPAVQASINRMRAALTLTSEVLDTLADQTGAHPELAAAFNTICEETGVTARVREALQTTPEPGYRWRRTGAGTWVYLNAEGADIGHAWKTAAGVWCADPWGREKRHFTSATDAKAWVEEQIRR